MEQVIEPTILLGIQATASFVVYVLVARWYVLPAVADKPLEAQLEPFVLVHAIRNVGLSVLAPGAMSAAVPTGVAAMIAFGDLAAMVLAVLSLVALRARWPGRFAIVWVFNVWAVTDLILASTAGVRNDLFSTPIGVNWIIVAHVVPALWVSSLIIFSKLLTAWRLTARTA